MVSPKHLLSVIESTLYGRTGAATAAQKIELIHAIRLSLPSLKALLSYPPPKPSDRAQVQSKQVSLPDYGPISLDDHDVQIALKLSDDLHLNEIDCVLLLVSANQQCGLLGREPLEVFRLAAGLWYTERRDLLTASYTLLRAVVLDQGIEDDILSDVQSYVEDLITSGFRERLIGLIKELRREDPTGSGGPSSESYVLDSRGALVERKAVISRERLILGHCLVLSNLIERASPKDVKDIFFALKESAADYSRATDSLNHQITYSLLFSLVIAFISDALGVLPDKVPVLSQDASFRREFHEILMNAGNDPVMDGFVDCVKLSFVVHLILVLDASDASEIKSSAATDDMRSICLLLEAIFSNNVFQFWLDKILLRPGFLNDDEDMVYMYYAYLHKKMTFFLSSPIAMDKVKDSKEKAMVMLGSHYAAAIHSQLVESGGHAQDGFEVGTQPFISLLEFVGEIYKKEPELMSGNDVVWTFVKFSGEDHNNFHTLVAFLRMLSSLACNHEGASKVFELLDGKHFGTISWSAMFDCLSIYEERNKQSLQIPGAVLPEFQHGDAKALMAYLNVLKQVVENGSPHQRKNWFPDIEPLFKLLSYENVPPYLKGALRDAVSVFVDVSPGMKDTIWRYLEQYDMPIVVGPNDVLNDHVVDTQVYDMRFELNEIEARTEQYPSTISFVNLVNTLIAQERDVVDRGRRFIGIFRFICDHVFGPFRQRAYTDPSEKWQLVVGCLKHLKMMLSICNVFEDDAVIDKSQTSTLGRSSSISTQIPILEIMKDFMSGKTLYRNVMSILLPGVSSLIIERTNQTYGLLIEKAILLSLEIITLVMEKDFILSDLWRPLYQPLDAILSQDHNQIVALLEYVKYDFQPQIQLCSIKILKILSERVIGLPHLLLKTNYASGLIEDYAACLELRSEECQVIEDSSMDSGVLIMQLLIENISRPAPNIAHLLLAFDVNDHVETTVLQPKFHYSCLKVLLDVLDKLSNPEVNALLHEFAFQLLYELCIDPLTSSPITNLLCTKKYNFFVKNLKSLCAAALSRRNCSQTLHISILHQIAWLLKLLCFELHYADLEDSNHLTTCRIILTELFGARLAESGIDHDGSSSIPDVETNVASIGVTRKNKVLGLLESIQCKDAVASLKMSQFVSDSKYLSLAEDVLSSSKSMEMYVYYNSERGDRLIDLASFSGRLWQKCSQLNTFVGEAELNIAKEAIQQLLRWGWKYNRNLEEQAAELHMLTSWSQIVEVCVSQRISFLENQSDVIFQLLDSSLDASGSHNCSLKMAQILTQVGLTCMAKLRNDRFALITELTSDTVTSLDIIMSQKLSNGPCHSILFKLIVAILRHESSEALRRRQYALLLSYLQYCWHLVDSDVSTMILQFFSVEELDEDLDLDKVDKDQAELERLNFAVIRKESQPFLDKVIKDATQGSELIRTMSLYVLDTLLAIDHDKFFLGQLQSRGFLRTCFMSISNFSYQDGGHSITSMQHLCTLEAELSLLLRISHKYGKSGLQVLISMGSLQHISACKALYLPMKHLAPRIGKKYVDVDRKRLVTAPILRFLFSLTSIVDASELLEVKNKVVREVMEFIKAHQVLFDQILQADPLDADVLSLELIYLVVSLLSKVWPYEESDEYGFIQRIFVIMRLLFDHQPDIFSSTKSVQSEIKQEADLSITRLCLCLSSYLHFLVTKKSLKLPVIDGSVDSNVAASSHQPSLLSLVSFLGVSANALKTATEEKYVLLNKIKDINELSKQEVDQIIDFYGNNATISQNTKKRKGIAVIGMCQAAGHMSQLIILLLLLAQNIMNVILTHLQDSSSYESEVGSVCFELIPIVERLESVNEAKVGKNLKVLFRLGRSLKEKAIQRLAA